MSSHKRRIFSFLGGFAISAACLSWLISSLDTGQLFWALRSANYYFVFAAFVFTLSSYLLRAWRWEYFFRSSDVAPSYYNLMRCLFVGFFMNNLLPARAGELVRAHVGGRHSAEGRTEVLATIASERLADGLVISILFSVFFSLDPAVKQFGSGKELFWVAYFFLAAAVGVFIVLALRMRLFSLLEKFNKLFPGKAASYSLDKMRRFVAGLEPLFHINKLVIVVPQSILIWGCEFFVYFLVSRAFHQELSFGALALFLAAVNFSSLIPAAPGGVGVIETFATIALTKVGVDREIALAMVVTQHLIQILAVGLPGSMFLYGTMGGKKDRVVESTTADASLGKSQSVG